MSATEANGSRVNPAVAKFNAVNSTHRGRRFLIAVASIVAAVALGAGLLRTDLFAVQTIDVSGAQRLDRATVLKKAGLRMSMPIVNVDEQKVAARLQTDPWVETATVTSEWPHKVSVQIVERRPMLLAQTTDNRWAELGAGGVVLSISDKPVPNLPVALGFAVEPKPGARLDPTSQSLVSVAAAMPESLRPQVTQMQEDQRGIRLGLSSGLVVFLGDASDLGAKLTSAATVLREVDTKVSETLDVSSPAMPVTTPRAASVAPTTTVKPPATTANSQARSNSQSQRQPSTQG